MLHSCIRSILCLALATVLPIPVWAADGEIRVIKVQGQVDVLDAQGQVRERARVGTVLGAGETLRTAEDSKAAIRSKAGDTFILDAAAAARVRNEKNTLQQLIGKIMYLFTPGLHVERTVQVQTAVMGIRGTTFVVNAEQDKAAVGLREGVLEVSSTDEGFNVYQRRETDEFEAFKQRDREKVREMKKEYEKYRAQVKEEFVAFKKSFQLNANQSLSIAGDKAVISSLDEDAIKTMRRLEEFISDAPPEPAGQQ
ncbi:MAG TPA: FecR domain-containing protein [Candidatus Paceibacterota bacterium]